MGIEENMSLPGRLAADQQAIKLAEEAAAAAEAARIAFLEQERIEQAAAREAAAE